jgi:hypothetical protein
MTSVMMSSKSHLRKATATKPPLRRPPRPVDRRAAEERPAMILGPCIAAPGLQRLGRSHCDEVGPLGAPCGRRRCLVALAPPKILVAHWSTSRHARPAASRREAAKWMDTPRGRPKRQNHRPRKARRSGARALLAGYGKRRRRDEPFLAGPAAGHLSSSIFWGISLRFNRYTRRARVFSRRTWALGQACSR